MAITCFASAVTFTLGMFSFVLDSSKKLQELQGLMSSKSDQRPP